MCECRCHCDCHCHCDCVDMSEMSVCVSSNFQICIKWIHNQKWYVRDIGKAFQICSTHYLYERIILSITFAQELSINFGFYLRMARKKAHHRSSISNAHKITIWIREWYYGNQHLFCRLHKIIIMKKKANEIVNWKTHSDDLISTFGIRFDCDLISQMCSKKPKKFMQQRNMANVCWNILFKSTSTDVWTHRFWCRWNCRFCFLSRTVIYLPKTND